MPFPPLCGRCDQFSSDITLDMYSFEHRPRFGRSQHVRPRLPSSPSIIPRLCLALVSTQCRSAWTSIMRWYTSSRPSSPWEARFWAMYSLRKEFIVSARMSALKRLSLMSDRWMIKAASAALITVVNTKVRRIDIMSTFQNS